MAGPDKLTGALGNIFSNMFSSGSQKYLIYVGWFMWALVIGIIGYLIYIFIMYKYKFNYIEGSIEDIKHGETTEQILRVLKVKKDRVRPIRVNGIDKWRMLFLWNKKIEPFDNKYILPGNNVFAFRTGKDTFNPIKISAGNPSANFSVDPFDRAFLNLGVQNDAREYMKDTDAKKAMWTGLLIGVCCLVAMVVSGWLILKYSASTAEKIEVVGNLLSGVTNNIAPG